MPKQNENLSKERTEKLIRKHLFTYRGKKAIKIPNYALDYSVIYLYRGITPSGNVKLEEIVLEGPNKIKTKNKIGKVYFYKGKWTLKVGRGTGTNILRL